METEVEQNSLEHLNMMLYEGGHVKIPDLPGMTRLMPGTQLTENPFDSCTGPRRRCKYMIVAATPDYQDYGADQHLTSPVGRILRQALQQAGFDLQDIYYTTATRFPRPIQASSTKISWLKHGWYYLDKEIQLVQPDAILFLGGDVCKLAFGQRASIDTYKGQRHSYHGVPAMVTTSHLSFVSNTAGLGAFCQQLEDFRSLGIGGATKEVDGLGYPDRDYKILWDADSIEEEIEKEITLASQKPDEIRWLAIDCETGNDTGRPEHDYILTFQWTNKHGHARVIPFYIEKEEPLVQAIRTKSEKVKVASKGDPVTGEDGQVVMVQHTHKKTYKRQGITKGDPVFNELGEPVMVPLLHKKAAYIEYNKGDPIFDEESRPVMVQKWGGTGVDQKSDQDRVPHYDKAVELVRKLFDIPNLGVIGHNLRGDLMWLRDCFKIPVRRFMNATRSRDTMLCYHLLEKDEYGLKHLTLRYTDMGAYEAPMHRWVLDHSGAGKMFPGEEKMRFFHAYRDIPYKYLLPYAMCDTDATWRVSEIVHERLHQPGNEKLARIYYNIELPVQHGIMDIETYGMPADPERLWELSRTYREKYDELVDELRVMVNWPELNVSSTRQMPALLYGGRYKDSNKSVLTVPDGAKVLGLTPVFSTGKYPKAWEDVVAAGEENYYSPSCSDDAMVKLLASEHLSDFARQVVDQVRKISAVKNFTKNFLSEPKFNAVTGPDWPLYGKGLIGCIDTRGRVCCNINQLSETGRWKHSKPNLANLPKNQESEVARLFEDIKVPKVRSGFKAQEGWGIMEADFCSAELYVMGYMSGDPEFIKVLESGVDVHGFNAVNVFHLDCHPDEVKDKHKDLRNAVKAIVFGMAYGLSVTGLSERLSVDMKRYVPVSEAQDIVDKFFTAYPVLKQFFEDLKDSAEHNGYVETAYGRRRYFPGVARLGREKLAAAKREAMNAPIQGTVADMLNVALINLDRMRHETEIGRTIGWEVCVGIHDALLVHFPMEHKQTMAEILRYCMSTTVPIPGTGGRVLGVDAECGERWQEFETVKLAA